MRLAHIPTKTSRIAKSGVIVWHKLISNNFFPAYRWVRLHPLLLFLLATLLASNTMNDLLVYRIMSCATCKDTEPHDHIITLLLNIFCVCPFAASAREVSCLLTNATTIFSSAVPAFTVKRPLVHDTNYKSVTAGGYGTHLSQIHERRRSSSQGPRKGLLFSVNIEPLPKT